MKLIKITPTGKKSQINVSDALFVDQPNRLLVSQAVRVFLANQRQAWAKTKTRSEVKRTKAKWYRQKGTGNARHGSKNAPIFVGGGVAHGPRGTRNYSLTLSKRQKRLALRSVLTLAQGSLLVSDLPLGLRKTKDASKFIDFITGGSGERVLLVLPQIELKPRLAFANLPTVLVETPEKLNPYQVTIAGKICFSTEAVKLLTQRLAAEPDETKAEPTNTTNKKTKQSK